MNRLSLKVGLLGEEFERGIAPILLANPCPFGVWISKLYSIPSVWLRPRFEDAHHGNEYVSISKLSRTRFGGPVDTGPWVPNNPAPCWVGLSVEEFERRTSLSLRSNS